MLVSLNEGCLGFMPVSIMPIIRPCPIIEDPHALYVVASWDRRSRGAWRKLGLDLTDSNSPGVRQAAKPLRTWRVHAGEADILTDFFVGPQGMKFTFRGPNQFWLGGPKNASINIRKVNQVEFLVLTGQSVSLAISSICSWCCQSSAYPSSLCPTLTFTPRNTKTSFETVFLLLLEAVF
ncbi:hypothetical protein IEQ34_002612 [Dendrobium chrysotoxum]|uniref:Uncharacterized protein n=1 Tax=Dendrobium chrysotoxum TaxID=161865 RepID=A0AAV7H1D2_DENCH|nr:hypothetical protein IEQ34_002612 [Dendrobium chrysotoxum]